MFRTGDTVMFDPDSFNEDYWNKESVQNKIRYYGQYGFGQRKLKLFTYICEHHPQTGHCVLMDMDDGKLLPMCHTNNFRLVEDDEC